MIRISDYLRRKGLTTYDQETMTHTYNYKKRYGQIQIIQDMLNGFELIHAKERWKTELSEITDGRWLDLYITFEYMKKVVEELKTLAPLMTQFTTERDKQVRKLQQMATVINWDQLFYEIYETLETKGDFFAYWSTEGENSKKDGIPLLKVLESEKMTDIVLNRVTHEPEAYIYEEDVWDENIDEATGKVTVINKRTVTWIFKKGYIRVNDAFAYPEEGYMIFPNGVGYEDEFRIIHVPSYKKQKNSFSDIPAIQYIDPCLLLDKLDSLILRVNERLGFPIPVLVGGRINVKKSALTAGGALVVDRDDWLDNSGDTKPDVHFLEVNNGLEPIYAQIAKTVSDLYKKACLIREELEEIVSSSDSSRNFSQLRIAIEQKNRKYYTNIAVGFAPYIKTVLKENKLWLKSDDKRGELLTWLVPDVLVHNSKFDEFLMTAQKRALGESTLAKELRMEGKTPAEIKAQKDEVTEELYTKGEDMSYDKGQGEATDIASNANNLDTKKINGLDNNLK